jgi:hypothetical protein
MAEMAVGKRIRINKIQQQMMLAALGTSLVLGVSQVLSVYFIKYINFNMQVIDEKDKSINAYYTTIKNVGICKTKNKDGKFSDKDLKECNPEAINAADMPGTLRNNVLIGMSEKNNDLESVSRSKTQNSCYASDGKRIDFVAKYTEASSISDPEEREKARDNAFYMLRMCSSLRVIPDSLPASKNDVALLSSLNYIFSVSGKQQPESLAPGGMAASPVPGLEAMSVSVTNKGDAKAITSLLQNIERSIRTFDFQSATISWNESEDNSQTLELTAQALAYYTNRIEATESTKTIYANKEVAKKNKKKVSAEKTDTVAQKEGENK